MEHILNSLKPRKVYLERFDVEVNCYLSLAQIQNIVNNIIQQNTYMERQQIINYMILSYATNLTQEAVDALDPEMALASGFLDAVKSNIVNYGDIEEGLKYHESVGKALSEIAKTLPEIIPDVLAEVNKNVVHK